MWCRTGDGRVARLDVAVTNAGVVVTASDQGPWVLPPLRVGRLRAALRDAALTCASLDPRNTDRMS